MVQYFPIVTGSLTVTGSVNVSGSITTNSTITATTLVVQTITSSISSITGSTQFGSLLTNTHVFSGSVTMNPGGLFVSGSGNVGIGTISPTNGKLEIQQTATTAGLWVQTGGTTTGSVIADFRTGTNLSALQILGNGAATFGSNLTSVGNLTIGSLSSGNDAIINFANNASAGVRTLYYKASNANINFTSTSGTDLMTITNGGFVGIGNASPSHTLTLQNGTAECGIRLTDNTNNTYFALCAANNNFANGTLAGDTVVRATNGICLTPNNGSSVALRINSTGFVGINTASPSSRLYVATAAGATKAYDDTTKTNIMVFDTTSMATGVGGSITFGGYKTAQTNGGNFAAIDGVKENGTAGNEAGAFRVWTANGSGIFSEAIRVTSAGNLMVGRGSDDGNKLSVNGTIRAEGGSGINVFSGGGTGPFLVDFPGVGGGRFNLDNSGNLTIRGSLTQNASDRRLKNNIQNIPDALNKINQINGITFNWDTNIYNVGKVSDIGVIAQEIQAVLPGAVTLAPFDTNHSNGESLSGENYLTVYYEKLIPLLIEGIKELNTKFEEYKATHP